MPDAPGVSEGGATGGSRIRILDATGGDPRAWDELAVRSPRGEAFQSHAWGERKRVTGWQPRRYRIVDDDGPLAVVSFQERDLLGALSRRLPTAAARSLAARLPHLRLGYAPNGPVLLRDGTSAARATLLALARIARARRAGLLLVEPFWEAGSAEAAALEAAGFRAARRPIQIATTGMLVPLEASDEAQRRLLNENVRRNLGRAQKLGVEVVQLHASAQPSGLEEALAAAYEMVRLTGERRGFAAGLRAPEDHNAGQAALIRSGVASLWMAYHEGQPVAHALVHHNGQRAFLFQAGESRSDPRRPPANFALQWSVLRWAAGEGFRDYDLGGVDDHEARGLPEDERHPMWNLYRFKSQWGARPVQTCGAQEYATWQVLGDLVNRAWAARDRARD